MTRIENKVTQDTALKNFWRDNQRFADLFNAVLFNGKEVLKAEDLEEVDTDVSSIVKFDKHIETVKRILDVVRKTAYGVDFIIWGLENQGKIHYAMPLRHMIGDSLIYLKEYQGIAAKNRKEKGFKSSDEFLSALKKTDRLHPVITLCVYYGEEEWDGPHNLLEMLEIPEDLEGLVSDYKMNLIQVRESEQFPFKNEDVTIVFDIVRKIYNEEYAKITDIYKDKNISAELGVIIGSIVESQKLINQAMKIKEKGSELNMCKALEKLMNECEKKGKIEGKMEGKIEGKIEGEQEGKIQGIVLTCRKFNISREETIKNLIEEFSFSEEEAKDYITKYWE